MWILISLCDSLQEQVVTTLGNAKALWDHLKDLFHDNKDARAISLDNELRAVKIGKMSVNEYCTKIKSMANRLKNLYCEVSEKNMVIYAVNGLDSRFATIAEIIQHREPLPSFEIVRNMLLLKESLFNDSTDASFLLECSSCRSTIHSMASSYSKPMVTRKTSSKSQNLPQLCNHFSRGTCKFGDMCKFIHDHRNRQGLNPRSNNIQPTVSQNHWGAGFGSSPNSQALRLSQARPNHFQPQALVSPVYYTPAGLNYTAQPSLPGHVQQPNGLAQQQQAVYMAQQHNSPDPFPSLTPVIALFPLTIALYTFIMYLSLLTSLKILFPFDFLTRHILLRSDSSGDLYPVTKLSTLPAAFVSTSSTTWHQRLGHPGDDHQSSTHPNDPNFHPQLHISNLEPALARTHTMVTQSQRGIVKPLERLSLHTSFVSPLPKSPFLALQDPNWSNAMYDEYNVLVKNGTWILVPRPTDANLGVDFDETFSLVVKPATIRTVLSLVVLRTWPIHQLDVKNAFLNGDLSETVYFVPEEVALELLERALMFEAKLGPNGVPVQDPTLYRSLVGGLQYLTFTHLDLSYAVQQVCIYMHYLLRAYYTLKKRILRYVRGTLELVLHLYASATTSLVGYTDADLAGCPSTQRSTSGYCVFLSGNLLLWSAKLQHTVSRSSMKYRGVANVVAVSAWLRNLLRELHSPLFTATLVYCDNVSAVYMSANPVQHQRTKHIEIDIHFVRDMVKAGHVIGT
ncbi:ribonuclease H-like domain-containing protein [Tanacetum coccineum]